MMSWIYYLLEANVYLVIFYGFFRILLFQQTFYQLNRLFLISASVTAFLLPVLQISYLTSLLKPTQTSAPTVVKYSQNFITTGISSAANDSTEIILVLYFLITGFFLLRLLLGLYTIFRMAYRNDKRIIRGVVQINISHDNTPFSFFNLLFLNPDSDGSGIIFKHELVHIRQKHTLDVLFFELLTIVNWFNPFCWLMHRDLKLIHEYIADEAAANSGLTKHAYAMFLIDNSFGTFPSALTSQIFNQSILKNRISMLNRKKSTGRARLRLLYSLPLIGGMLCASTLGFTKTYTTVDLFSKPTPSPTPSVRQEPQPKSKSEKKAYHLKTEYVPEAGGTKPVKLIVINGKVSNARNYISVTGYDHVKELSSVDAIAKYGKRASKGALEFTGKNAGIAIKFPPPLVSKPRPSSVPKHKNETIKFPPPLVEKDAPEVPKEKEKREIKFPPPIVKPLNKSSESEVSPKNTATLDVGPNPLFIIDGKQTVVNPPEGTIIKFTAKSAKVHPKNNQKVIDMYGELARDGVIELEDGKIFYDKNIQ